MHFEFLVEDVSGKMVLDAVLPKILVPCRSEHTFRVISYKGIGQIPKRMTGRVDARKRILLDRLPKLLAGYGKSHQLLEAAVVLVVDLDRRACLDFKQQLLQVLAKCTPRPKALFRIAVEEIEAWLLGDRSAIEAAYPNARAQVLDGYVQDSICGTWELLADAIHTGGSSALLKEGWPAPGRAKCDWATKIAPLVDVETNVSPSFQTFRDGVRALAGIAAE